MQQNQCCRQRLTIYAINYSGRASELGGIIDLVDRRRSSLSRSERPPFSSQVDNTFLTMDTPLRNFLRPEFTTKFQREVPLFLEITEFPFSTVYDGWKEAHMPKTSSIRSAVLVELRLVTDGRTDTAPWLVPRMLSIGAVKTRV